MIETMITETLIKEKLNPKLGEYFDSKISELKPLSELDEMRKPFSNELTVNEKIEIKEKTNWPNEIVDNISSVEEANIYMDANLEVREINGRPCLVKSEIDGARVDEMGRTNDMRMANGLAPLDKDGTAIELHHIGQKNDSPLAELTQSEHRGSGNDTILHNKKIDSEIVRGDFNTERKHHWKERANN